MAPQIIVQAQEMTECKFAIANPSLKANTPPENISDLDYTDAWRFVLDQSDKCWFYARMTSHATWGQGIAITASYQAYGFESADSDDCKTEPDPVIEYYPRNQIMHTARTPWPYKDQFVCAYNITFQNDRDDDFPTVEVYSFLETPPAQRVNGSTALGLSSLAAVALATVSHLVF